MHCFDNKETCEMIQVDDTHLYYEFVNSHSADVLFVPEKYRDSKGFMMKADAGYFAKWMRKTKPDIKIDLRKSDGKLILRSSDLWLPLAYLASNVALPMYLNLVTNYLYDRMRGALRGEKSRVHLDAIYEDKQDGIVKKFCFEGNIDELEKVIKKFDLNKFLDK